jgi:hypothetical protein
MDMSSNGSRVLKILKKSWTVREYQTWRISDKYNVGSLNKDEYIPQDSFIVPSDGGSYSEFDCVILVTTDILKDVAQKFQDHVHKVGDEIRVAVVYI